MKVISKKQIIDYINDNSNYLLPQNANTEMAEMGAQAQLEVDREEYKELEINYQMCRDENSILVNLANELEEKMKKIVEIKPEEARTFFTEPKSLDDLRWALSHKTLGDKLKPIADRNEENNDK